MENVLDKELYKYFLLLNDNQKNSLLNMIKSFMQSNVKETTITTIAEYNDDLDKSMSRINKGDFTTLENLEAEMHQW